MKRFTVPFEIKQHEQSGHFWGYASVFDVLDLQKERVIQGAFRRTLEQRRAQGNMPKMLWQHDARLPIGVWKEIQEDHYGLWVEGQLLLDIRQGQEAYSLMKAGVIDGLSIGFVAIKTHHCPRTKSKILEQVDLYEISLVTFAANPLAKITGLKASFSEEQRIVQRLIQMAHSLWEIPY